MPPPSTPPLPVNSQRDAGPNCGLPSAAHAIARELVSARRSGEELGTSTNLTTAGVSRGGSFIAVIAGQQDAALYGGRDARHDQAKLGFQNRKRLP